MSKNAYEAEFSEDSFWDKLTNFAKKAGYDVIEKALLLYYSAQEDKTPKWAKMTIYGALGYFIAPLDAVADITPGIGFTDDLGVLALAVTVVAVYINDNVRSKAAQKMDSWFGPKFIAANEAADHEDDEDSDVEKGRTV